MSWIYAIAIPHSPPVVKIGSSKRTAYSRLRSGQTWHVDPLEVLAKVRLRGDPKPIESRIRHGLRAHNVRWGTPSYLLPRGARELFYRAPEVEAFIDILRAVKSADDLAIYVARLHHEPRCDRCWLPIALAAPLSEVARCGGCDEAAQADGERLRAGKTAARVRRDAQRDALLPAMPEEETYLTVEGVAKHIKVQGHRFIRREVEAGRLRAIRFQGSSDWWFRPEWVDAWVTSMTVSLEVAVAP